MCRIIRLTEVHSSVETIETKHDRYSANKGGFDVIVPVAPIEKVLEDLGIVCLRRQVLQDNQQDEKAHDKDDKGKGFDSGQETPQDCSHKYGQRYDCEEGQCYVPFLRFILRVCCTGQSKDDVGRQEGHSGSTSLPGDSNYPAHEIGQEVGKPGRS
jgi:hypothetical protein